MIDKSASRRATTITMATGTELEYRLCKLCQLMSDDLPVRVKCPSCRTANVIVFTVRESSGAAKGKKNDRMTLS